MLFNVKMIFHVKVTIHVKVTYTVKVTFYVIDSLCEGEIIIPHAIASPRANIRFRDALYGCRGI